jgi:hypothetical protein
MKRLIVWLAVVTVSLVITSVAFAGIYAGPKQWFPGQSASTGFSANWLRNYFSTYGSGYDKTVTFIDNRSYGWRNTVRNGSQTTETYPPFGGVYKGHCIAHSYGFYGSCTIR